MPLEGPTQVFRGRSKIRGGVIMSSAEEHEKISLNKSQEVAQLLEERGIHDDEVKRVIYNAETTGDKLYQQEGDRFLARLGILEATFYVEYSISGENYTVHTAYAHKAEVVEK